MVHRLETLTVFRPTATLAWSCTPIEKSATAWWHRVYFVHPIEGRRGVVIYHNPPEIYHGGDWHGRDYVADPAHGGYYPVHVHH